MQELEYTTQLAIQRTVMAADRTLMAWIRTALSMISFGFTIYKVLEGLQDSAALAAHDIDGRRAGLLLTGLGTISILVGMLEYFMTMRDIRKRFALPHWRYPLVIAFVTLLIGSFIFVAIWIRLA